EQIDPVPAGAGDRADARVGRQDRQDVPADEPGGPEKQDPSHAVLLVASLCAAPDVFPPRRAPPGPAPWKRCVSPDKRRFAALMPPRLPDGPAGGSSPAR